LIFPSLITMNSIDNIKPKIHSQDSIPSFIRKTYDILEEAKFPDIIDWNPEGTALVIKKTNEFCQKVLPAYFKHNNLTSFVRQLNMYNFHKRRTQNLDQVYSHELFQRGKRHLLKEIKRKTHEQTLDKASKPSEFYDLTHQGKDISSLSYENQILKRLYNDALAKLNVLEGEIKELNSQNQSLWSRLYQNNDSQGTTLSLNSQEKQLSLTQDQLPMTLGEIYIPPLRLGTEQHASIASDIPFAKTDSVGCFFNLNNEESCESTEASYSSPSIQPCVENERYLELTEVTPSTSNSDFPNDVFQFSPSQSPQFQASLAPNDLFISGRETSIGQLIGAWSSDFQENDGAYGNSNALLGKRSFDNLKSDPQLEMFELPVKHSELSAFKREGQMNNSVENQEMLRRECAVNASYDMGMDFLSFNNDYNWSY